MKKGNIRIVIEVTKLGCNEHVEVYAQMCNKKNIIKHMSFFIKKKNELAKALALADIFTNLKVTIVIE